MTDQTDHQVVVGVDGSPASIAALGWAAQAAEERGAALCVVGVDPDVHDHFGSYLWGTSSRDERMTALDTALTVLIEQVLGAARAATVRRQVEEGRPGEVLARVADKADLLVIGSRRVEADEAPRPVLRACLQHATCPVVVVNEAGQRPIACRPTGRLSSAVPARAGPAAEASTAMSPVRS